MQVGVVYTRSVATGSVPRQLAVPAPISYISVLLEGLAWTSQARSLTYCTIRPSEDRIVLSEDSVSGCSVSPKG